MRKKPGNRLQKKLGKRNRHDRKSGNRLLRRDAKKEWNLNVHGERKKVVLGY
jgi:hypothetical protein